MGSYSLGSLSALPLRTKFTYHHKKRSPYYRPYNENHLEREGGQKSKKRELRAWDSDDFIPPKYYHSPTKVTKKGLMNEINREYMEEIKAERKFPIPDYRSGDVIEATFIKSTTEPKPKVQKGLIIGTKA
jgi:hypothetical protein